MTVAHFSFYLIFFLFFGGYHLSSLKNLSLRWKYILGFSFLWLIIAEPQAVIPLIITTQLVWFCGKNISVSDIKAKKKKFWLLTGTALCFVNWFIVQNSALSTKFAVSFYSLQLIGYLVDRYRGHQFISFTSLELLTSVSAFYSLTAGPILRTRDHILELKKPSYLTVNLVRLAIFRILWGLTKKSAGDLLGDNIQGYLLFNYHHSSISAWTNFLSITAQFYLDLSGYSDIAIGLASLLGIKIPENFNLPFLATNMADQWRRWHASLGRWFYEYVFLSLCLYKPIKKFKPTLQISVAVMITMILVGIWHGLNTNNFIWGIYNGILILIGAWAQKRFSWLQFKGKTSLAIGLTFFAGMFGRVLNRIPDWKTACVAWQELFQAFDLKAMGIYEVYICVATLAALVIPHVIDWLYITKLQKPSWVWVTFVASILFFYFILIFGMQGKPFL